MAGTGWVQEAVDRAPLTEVGQIFRIGMYHPNPWHETKLGRQASKLT